MSMNCAMIGMITILSVALLGVTSTMAAEEAEAPRIELDRLKARLGDANLVILDVRAEKDWVAGGAKIKGAIREDPKQIDAWAPKYAKNKEIVLYCA